jgi:hypothetical protein
MRLKTIWPGERSRPVALTSGDASRRQAGLKEQWGLELAVRARTAVACRPISLGSCSTKPTGSCSRLREHVFESVADQCVALRFRSARRNLRRARVWHTEQFSHRIGVEHLVQSMGSSSLRPTSISRQPIRAFKYNSPSLPLTRSSRIGVTPSGGRVPKIVATMKWPTLAFSLVAPVCSSFPKCRRSVFRQIGLSRRSRTTIQICSSGIPRPAMTSTFCRCAFVG